MKGIDENQRRSAERWLEYRQSGGPEAKAEPAQERTVILSTDAQPSPAPGREKIAILNRDGAEMEP